MTKPQPLDQQIRDLRASLRAANERFTQEAPAAPPAPVVRQVPSELADTYLEGLSLAD